MARRYDVRVTRNPWDRFWGVVTVMLILAVIASASEWVAVGLLLLLVVWWITMRCLRAIDANRDR